MVNLVRAFKLRSALNKFMKYRDIRIFGIPGLQQQIKGAIKQNLISTFHYRLIVWQPIMKNLCLEMEQLYTPASCTLLLFHKQSGKFYFGASPSIPTSCAIQLNGLSVPSILTSLRKQEHLASATSNSIQKKLTGHPECQPCHSLWSVPFYHIQTNDLVGLFVFHWPEQVKLTPKEKQTLNDRIRLLNMELYDMEKSVS